MNYELFVDKLKERGILITTLQLEQFKLYQNLLITENKKFNLTSITDEEEIIEKHFYDSLTILNKLNYQGTLLDIGTGGGFPGIPLKIMLPELKIILSDSTQKKLIFLETVIAKLKLKNITTLLKRAEEIKTKYDFVVSRGVAKFSILNELCLPLVKVGGYFIAYKGSEGLNEYNQGKRGLDILGGQLDFYEELYLNKQENKRINFFIKKINDTPTAYPRLFATIKKSPLE
ncbi:MAG: 16S rRNA (guanine(527)-N(7))-methyltransferase RsmG [Bacillales bacterium]|jgi:16S rRNA (guanine527-N7)-methyltransferase|nr:16S rRNA (guanine(527)-N(7))-methyltransferase RsmG [Bacillales bacterium]